MTAKAKGAQVAQGQRPPHPDHSPRLQRLADERDDLAAQVEVLTHRLDVAKSKVERLRQRVISVATSASAVCRRCLDDATES